jgi:glycosyltransferase involved in cell wall biosynthesis
MGAVKPRIFLKIHGASANEVRKSSLLIRRLMRYLDGKVAGYGIFTREEAEELKSLGLDESKFYFVRNAIDKKRDVPGDFVRSDKLPSDKFDIRFASRFIATKGLLETIRAAAILRDRKVKFSMFCLRDGPIRDEAEELAGQLRLDSDVIFTGYVSEADVTKHLLTDDIFVFPTKHTEGFPIALFKAAALGMPIVTTKIRAAAEYFTEPENCLFCSNDPTDIADRLQQLINSKQLRETMSAANEKFGSTEPRCNIVAS